MGVVDSCQKAATVLGDAFEPSAILTGVSDTIVVKRNKEQYRMTPLMVCFGPFASTHAKFKVTVTVNDHLVPAVTFELNSKGYIVPQILKDRQVKQLGLGFGRNKVEFGLDDVSLHAEIYLFSDNDRLVVSDVDGTATKNDIGGHIHNIAQKDYLHAGYAEFLHRMHFNGYKIVWLTMRALPLYNYSKEYIREHCRVDGPLMTEPEEFSHALLNEITKNTGNIKANMVKTIADLFSSNPFVAGLGNREGDAIAYRAAGIPFEAIYFVDTKSNVQRMDTINRTSYDQMANEVDIYFPAHSAPKVCYM